MLFVALTSVERGSKLDLCGGSFKECHCLCCEVRSGSIFSKLTVIWWSTPAGYRSQLSKYLQINEHEIASPCGTSIPRNSSTSAPPLSEFFHAIVYISPVFLEFKLNLFKQLTKRRLSF